jgi:hypothetical protein
LFSPAFTSEFNPPGSNGVDFTNGDQRFAGTNVARQLLCTAWDGAKLVGVARSITDFEYCCYLSDLAVDEKYQKGIGKELINQTRSKPGSKAKIILLSAPKLRRITPKLGLTRIGQPGSYRRINHKI